MSECAVLERKVHLVGAGPGDPDLLTVKALRLIERADVVVFDRLVGAGVLDLVPAGARRVPVGKTGGRPGVSQERINRLLVELAVPGRRVVRLKGGDPFVFGRGGEEALHLWRHGVAVEVVPGITAALGCAAAAMIPLTHRGVATGVRFVTGHCRAGWWLDLDWEGLADPGTTLVFYMGTAHLGEIAARLIAAGLSWATPAAAVAEGTTPRQRVVRAPLGELAATVGAATLDSPVLFVVGPVVEALHDGRAAPEMLPVRALLAQAGHA
ncbi:MAG: uroporphyrinogen-III C-methyltransferase [Geminicoccaceae bacterium]|nr:uroporphyrinogen-III C-methyltransferase [Geminicoccaceae bacterium]